MKKNARDNLAKFFYDCGKVSYAVLVVGILAKGIFSLSEFLPGIVSTLILAAFGFILDLVLVEDEK